MDGAPLHLLWFESYLKRALFYFDCILNKQKIEYFNTKFVGHEIGCMRLQNTGGAAGSQLVAVLKFQGCYYYGPSMYIYA